MNVLKVKEVDQVTERVCPTCGASKASGAFYVNCSECKECKRERSRRARLIQARKIAAFERFVNVLFDLSARTADTDMRRGRQVRTAPSIEAQGDVVKATPNRPVTTQEATS